MTRRNEKKTEELVRRRLQSEGVRSDGGEHGWRYTEQNQTDETIRRCLRNASKQGGRGLGKPEFIVTNPDLPDFVVVIECKANPKFHSSNDGSKPKDYACDGALHYAKCLSAEYDVVAVAVSGETDEEAVYSAFIWRKGAAHYDVARDRDGEVKTWRTVAQLHACLNFDPSAAGTDAAHLLRYAKQLHNQMRDYAKLSEQEKPLLVAAVLLALWDPVFEKSYSKFPARELPVALYDGLCRTIDRAKMDGAKPEHMKGSFQFITTHDPLRAIQEKSSKSVLQTIIAEVFENVRPYLTEDIDMLGQFYGEFLRYTGGDKKGLGIVLTPRHVADLFARLANVGPEDTVFDPCAGTGGFLLAAMSRMLKQTDPNNDQTLRGKIRRERLVGVEQQPTMFALAASNMMFHGDGRANLRLGSCFDEEITDAIINPPSPRRRPSIGFINPPYSQKGPGLDELSFISHMLDCLSPGGTGVAIVPMSCAITPSAGKAALLKKHTLLAVMSMPTELFYPVGTVTCIMVFRAHQPHDSSPQATWFGYWKDDGFIKTKDRGRVDAGDWTALCDQWVLSYHNRMVEPGRSVVRVVTAEDEWCAEAYMETDYSKIDRNAFEKAVRDHLLSVALSRLNVGTVVDEDGGE